MPSTITTAAAVLAALAACGATSVLPQQARQTQTHLLADLDYGSFQGAYSEQYNISYWQKIPYAAPPVGENRFRGPQPPAPVEGVYDSSQSFDMCPQRTVNGSEDCLYLGLYSRPWTKGQPLKPVVVTFYGGGFIQGSAYFTIPPSAYPILNVSSSSDMMFIYPNYRTNAFGLLPGKEVAADPSSDLNAGLLDQEAVLRWTRKHVAEFGGDPEDVTIWGQSAGGGSVLAQALGRGGENRGQLFRRAMASSPFWPKTYAGDGAEAQALYDELAERAGCAGPDSLACLKRADVQTIRGASLPIASSHQYNTSTFTWAPVIDGEFLREPLSAATAAGRVNMDRAFAMHNTHEGENFIPPGFQGAESSGSPPFNSSEASFDQWLRGFLPGLGECEIESVKKLYPAAGSTETISYNTTYVRAGLIYRDVVLSCPAYWFVGSAPEAGWLGEYSLNPSKHASDTVWWNQVNAVQKTDPTRYQGYAGAFASFFQTGDPNALKLSPSTEAGVPPLKDNKEWTIVDAGFETAQLEHLEKRCGFWKNTAAKIPI